MASFTCNICGARQDPGERIDAERASCVCGSNVRMRALINFLSVELFGQSLPLPEFPKIKAIRALGMTDNECYARPLAEKFDYTNSYYDQEPPFDFTEAHPDLYGTYHFILSADVLEHIAPPVERALDELCRLLRPDGFLVATVPCPSHKYLEHFPELYQYRVVPLANTTVLVNRRRDGTLEITEDLRFHSGTGATLEMRQFSPARLKEKLFAGGFDEVEPLNDPLPQIGVAPDSDSSQLFIARKEKFEIRGMALSQLIETWRTTEKQRNLLEKQISMASTS